MGYYVGYGRHLKEYLEEHPELVGLMYILKVFITIIALVVIVWLSRNTWYKPDTGEIDAWALIGISLVTVFLSNIVFTIVFGW
jgi:hypothetical protein